MARYATKGEKVKLLSFPKDYVTKMKAQPGYKWYKPILAALLAFIAMVIIDLVIMSIEDAFDLFNTGSSANVAQGSYTDTDFTNPISIIVDMLEIICVIPALWIGMKLMKLGGLRGLSSEQGGLRWKRIASLALPLFLVMAVLDVGITFGELFLTGGSLSDLGTPRFAPLALLAIVIVVPLQCAAEEYLFRGFVLQMFGAWIPVAPIALILSVVLFSLGHDYNILGVVDVGVSGLLWGWLAIKTGGLEASICLHSANNVVAMLFTSVYMDAAAVTDVTVGSLVFDVVIAVITVAVAYLICKRKGYLIANK